MALVTLVIQDAPDGTVSVQAFAEPMLQDVGPDGELTKAQAALLIALNAIDSAAHKNEPAVQVATPSIIVPN